MRWRGGGVRIWLSSSWQLNFLVSIRGSRLYINVWNNRMTEKYCVLNKMLGVLSLDWCLFNGVEESDSDSEMGAIESAEGMSLMLSSLRTNNGEELEWDRCFEKVLLMNGMSWWLMEWVMGIVEWNGYNKVMKIENWKGGCEEKDNSGEDDLWVKRIGFEHLKNRKKDKTM